jgi:hypothetical protein
MGEVSGWLLQHRQGLSVLIHPNTGCHELDHSTWPMWMGSSCVGVVSTPPAAHRLPTRVIATVCSSCAGGIWIFRSSTATSRNQFAPARTHRCPERGTHVAGLGIECECVVRWCAADVLLDQIDSREIDLTRSSVGTTIDNIQHT